MVSFHQIKKKKIHELFFQIFKNLVFGNPIIQ